MIGTSLGRYVTLTAFFVGCTQARNTQASNPGGIPSTSELGPEFAPAEGDVIVKNSNLARTYWSVVRAKDGSHYILPRPDGAAPLARECEAGTPLASKLTDHALCKSAQSEASVAKVNNLDGSFALEVSTVLHRELAFERNGDNITPSPLGRDLLELCQSDANLREGAMKDRCAEERMYADGGQRPAIFRSWAEAELVAVPAALNRLYGVR